MATSLAAKLRIKAGNQLLAIHPPVNFRKQLGTLPASVTISTDSKAPDQIHWFVSDRAQLEKELSRVLRLLKPGVIVWAYYPKGSSKFQTDLTRDKGWDCLLKEEDKLAWINLISFDDSWSVFGFRAKTEDDIRKAARPKEEREIFKWVNPATKEVRLPEDLAATFRKHKKEAKLFDSLAFSHKKEYLEWILTAKKDETRQKRIQGTIERLGKNWKNPSNN